MADQGLTIHPGHNVWLLARTDRDAPSPDTVVDDAAAFMDDWIGDGGVMTPFDSPLGSKPRYYIGAARPLELTVLRDRPTTMPSTVLSRQVYTDQPELYALAASRPWYVIVEFDWRGPMKHIDWPHQAQARSNTPLPEQDRLRLDWLLLEARNASANPVWADSSVASDYGTAAGEAATKLGEGAKNVVLVLGSLLVLALVVRSGGK